MVGVAFPHRWHFNGMFPRNVLRFVPFRPISNGYGFSDPATFCAGHSEVGVALGSGFANTNRLP
jgi:hypothetical protein